MSEDIKTKIIRALKENTGLFDPYAERIPPFKDLAAKHQINAGAFLAIGLGLVSIVILLLQGWAILLTCLTVLYPSLHSVRAIDDLTNEKIQADKEKTEKAENKVKFLMTYWIIFGVFSAVETFLGFVFWLIPYYEWVRVGFFVFLLTDKIGGKTGSQIVYETALQPLLKQHKETIAAYIEKVKAEATTGMTAAGKQIAEKAKDPSVLAAALDGAQKLQKAADDAIEGAEVAKN